MLEPEQTGGVVGGRGYARQARYALLHVLEWLDRGLAVLQYEGGDDIELRFADGTRELHQVKRNLTLSEALGLFARHGETVARSGDARCVIACTRPDPKVCEYEDQHQLYRRRLGAAEPVTMSAELSQTRDVLAARLPSSHHSEQLRRAFVDQCRLVAFYDRDADAVSVAVARYAEYGESRLGVRPPIDEISSRVCAPFQAHLADLHRDRLHTRDELHAKLGDLFRGALASGRRHGPVVIRHDSVARVAASPNFDGAPESVRIKLVAEIALEQLDLPQFEGGLRGHIGPESAVAEILDPTSELHRTLAASPDSPVVYYGIPHIPLAALVGSLLQGRQIVPIDKQHHADGRVGWVSDSKVLSIDSWHGSVAPERGRPLRIRVSISGLVSEAAAEEILPGLPDVELRLCPSPGRGVVRSWEQFVALQDQLRALLDNLVSEFAPTLIHLMPACSPSIALALGKIVAGTMYPSTRVYDFKGGRFVWGLDLGTGSVEHFVRAGDALDD